MVGILGTFMGIYTQTQINHLQSELAETNKKHNMLVQVTDRHETVLQDLVKDMQSFMNILTMMAEYNPGLLYAQLNEQIEEFLDRITVVENAIQQLQHRRLSTDLLTVDQLQQLHDAVNKVAEREDYQVLPERIGDYFQIEVSYVRKGLDVDILIHVPCIKANSLLTIYKYVSFPFPLPVSTLRTDISITETLSAHTLTLDEAMGLFDNKTTLEHQTEALYVSNEDAMIAIGRDHTFRMTSQSDLVGCIQRNHVYLCDKHQVVRTDLHNTCLGSLYLRNAEGVRAHCKFEKRPLMETVYQLTNIDHLVFTPKQLTTQMSCRNGSIHPIFLQEASRITVPQGCEVKLASHHIMSDSHFDAATPPLQYEWRWDPESMPSHLLEGSAHLDQQIQALRTHLYNTQQTILNKTDFSTLMTETLITPSHYAYLFWPLFLPSLAVALGLFAWCYYRRRHTMARRLTRLHNGDRDNIGQPMIVIQPPYPVNPILARPRPEPVYPDPNSDDEFEDEISRLART